MIMLVYFVSRYVYVNAVTTQERSKYNMFNSYNIHNFQMNITQTSVRLKHWRNGGLDTFNAGKETGLTFQNERAEFCSALSE